MSRMLMITFHKAEVLLKEDALFKHHALSTGLVLSEGLDEARMSFDPRLKEDAKSGEASGVVDHEYSGLPPQFSLNRVGFNAWTRPEFKRRRQPQSLFESWFRPGIEQAATCLVVGGHHGGTARVRPVVWGQKDSRVDVYRWFTALVPGVRTTASGTRQPSLEVHGHPFDRSRRSIVRAGPFNLSETLRECRLLVIFGCNGSIRKNAGLWQEWVDLVSTQKPIVLGWYGLHGMPHDQHNEFISPPFWTRLKQLATQHGLSLKELCEQRADDVIRAWGSAGKEAFSASAAQQHLWYDSGSMVRGLGAFDPSGNEWRVTSADGPIQKVAQ